MNNPLISVPIPVYKIEPYLDSCIRSVAGQTYRNLDIILLVQPCEDGSAQIAAEWAKKDIRVRVVELSTADLANARNESVANAYGDIICFVDGDDLIHREHIERLYNTMEETGADIVQGKVYAFHNENALPETIPGTGETVVMDGREFEIKRQRGEFGSWATVAQTKLYRKDLFMDVTFPAGRICEDVATVFRLYSKADKIAVVDMESYFYRSNREGSITHDPAQIRRITEHGYLAKRDMWEFFRDYDPEIAAFCAYYISNDIARARSTADPKEFKGNGTLAEMYRRKNEFFSACDARYIGRKRRLLAALGRYLPKLWYKLNTKRTNRARRIEWADKE